MKGLREFIIGFSFSLTSVSLGGQLYTFDTPAKTEYSSAHTKIDLFKSDLPVPKNIHPRDLFANIEHHSLIKDVEIDASIGQLPQSTVPSIDTPNDDEILSVNIDGMIPIDYSEAHPTSQQVEVTHFEEADISATLPTNITHEENFTTDTPWTVAKGNNKYIKNKQLLQELESTDIVDTLSDNFSLTLEENNEDSYKVAEKIKSSLLFPIPNEILNDENLTPTFIKKKSNKVNAQKKNEKQPATKTTQKELAIIPQQSPQQSTETEASKGFLDNISSWFTPTQEEKPQPRAKTAPSYSSQEITHKIPEASSSDNNEFISFYKTLQETNTAHQNNSIIPSELKLSFQPGRAEISGQTLRWLKAFSEAAQDDDTYLQVRLDVSASTELQRKRLNLLYTIFMNNGVDFKKIDTVFSLTEPNAFIIRTLKVR